MKSLNKLIITFTLLTSIITSLKAQHVSKGFSSPESVASDGHRYFVSEIGPGLNKTAKDSDGFISEIAKDGKIINLHFLPDEGHLNSPRGMVITNGILYVADLDRILGFDIKTRKKVFTLNFGPNTGLLNDLAVIDNSTIVVSDIFKDKIYKINTYTKQSRLIGKIGGPNGLIYNQLSRLLYACGVGHNGDGKGHFYKKDVSNKQGQWEELKGGNTGFFDGIVFLNSNELLVSDWISMTSKKGRLILYDIKRATSKTIDFGETPADIFYDKYSGQIFVPQTNKNQIVILKPNQLSGNLIRISNE